MDGHGRNQNYSRENQEQFSLYHCAAVQTPYTSFYTASSASEDLTSLDCETEDGVEVSEEETAKLPPVRTSISKRNRAAEVHNLSEKRRRSRINEKLKALQALIPNSSKTDKASMLDEAIEYLKQLQLQVQVLSVRNSLSQHPMFVSGVLQPLQASQMGFIDLGTESGITTGVGILPLDQGSSVPQPCNVQTSSHESASMPSRISASRPLTSSAMESTFLPMSIEDILSRELTQYQHPNARDFSRNNCTDIPEGHL